MATDNIPCGIAVPQTLSSSPVHLQLIREFLHKAETLGYEGLLMPGMRTYADGCPPGSYDPNAQLKVMDEEGIDMALLYPTIGICWEGVVKDPKLATAYTRAYNRWLVDFCRENPKRLYPVAHISLLDPEGAERLFLLGGGALCTLVS